MQAGFNDMNVTTVLFIHPGRAALPELMAYRDFIQQELGLQCKEWCLGQDTAPDWSEIGLAWVIMGRAPAIPKGIPVVHEYASLSTGHGAKWKDLWKRLITPRPDLRIFLNPWVQSKMGFKDMVPSITRDMGIWKGFFLTKNAQLSRGLDWLYAGSVSPSRGLDRFLEMWCNNSPRPTLHLIGKPDSDLQRRFNNAPGLVFHGHCTREAIMVIASQCGYGLNLVPDIYPYSEQTCTKVLEYTAMGLRIVSSRTKWMERFVSARQMTVLWLPANMQVAGWESVSYRNADVSDLEWGRVLADCGLKDQLLKITSQRSV